MPQTQDQKRAAHAFKAVEMIPDGSFKDIKTESKKLPTRVINSGLGQALTFLIAKKKDTEHMVRSIDDWAEKTLPGTGTTLLQRILNEDSDYLRRATDEILAYMQWYIRFIEAQSNRKKQDIPEG